MMPMVNRDTEILTSIGTAPIDCAKEDSARSLRSSAKRLSGVSSRRGRCLGSRSISERHAYHGLALISYVRVAKLHLHLKGSLVEARRRQLKIL